MTATTTLVSWIARRKTSTVVTLTTGEVYVLHIDGRRFYQDLSGNWVQLSDGFALDLGNGARYVWSMGKLVLSVNSAI